MTHPAVVGGAYPPLDDQLQGFPNARRSKAKTWFSGGMRRRWKEADGTTHEWDYQHGRVEKYDARGNRLGEFDPGDRLGPAIPGRGHGALNMTTMYQLVGYDLTSEFLEERYDIPPEEVARAKRAAGIAATGIELLGDWPLSTSQARAIAELIHLVINRAHRDYFLEPYVTTEGRTRHSHAV